jgi:hypothetical protein
VKDGGQTQKKDKSAAFRSMKRHKGRRNQRERTHWNNAEISRVRGKGKGEGSKEQRQRTR